jgi:hypothetical protein
MDFLLISGRLRSGWDGQNPWDQATSAENQKTENVSPHKI